MEEIIVTNILLLKLKQIRELKIAKLREFRYILRNDFGISIYFIKFLNKMIGKIISFLR
jgi:hypothetical protein